MTSGRAVNASFRPAKRDLETRNKRGQDIPAVLYYGYGSAHATTPDLRRYRRHGDILYYAGGIAPQRRRLGGGENFRGYAPSAR